jgi:hypothetical protein
VLAIGLGITFVGVLWCATLEIISWQCAHAVPPNYCAANSGPEAPLPIVMFGLLYTAISFLIPSKRATAKGGTAS